ncbi:MAG TPA: LysM peptidoglycan-binding domain-containing protein, partial [Euzebyales bacterium]|nr:LysM peptidoglycan-binding domain-containing protein [Euzebyales bacterium]
STHRLRDATTGLLATAALLAIVVGVPVALVRFVGWPLPSTVPTVDAIGAALRYGHVAPGTLLKALAVIVWMAWLLLTAGVLLEAMALLRGTVARTVPTLAGVQRLCARLLTSAMLLSTLASRPAVAAQVPQAPATMAPTADPAPHPTAVERVVDTPAWVVRRHDSLWTIAERTLGAGHRWREIRDLNVGRPQPGGGRLRVDDPMIRPGWVLRLPPDATTGDRPAEVEVERGDHLWGLAEEHLGDGTRWRELYARNRGAPQPDGGRLTRPNLVQPGWMLTLPRQDGPDPREERDGSRDTPRDRPADRSRTQDDRADRRTRHDTPVAPLPLTPRTQPQDGAAGASEPSPVPPGGPGPAAVSPPAPSWPETEVMVASARRVQPGRPTLPVAGSALLAAGLVAMLARRRRQWLRRRRPGSALDPVDAEAAELERWLRDMADHDLSQRTDRVLRVLAEHFGEHAVHPAVLALEMGERVGLLLSTSDLSPPPGITAADGGRTWLVDAELEVAAPLDDDGPPVIAALVGCGRRATGEIVALNLLEAGVVDVDGSAAQVEEAVTSWTAELAARGAAAGVELIVVGPHHHLVEQFARVILADDAHAASARIAHTLDGPGPGPSQVVVLTALPATGGPWDALRRRAREDPRLALVSARADREAVDREAIDRPDHRLRLDGDHVRLDPAGIELIAPEWLTPQTWERFGDLLCQPVRQQQSDLVPSPLLSAPFDRGATDPAPGGGAREAPDRTVRVLGPLRIDGIPTLDRLASEALAVLAVHRQSMPVDTLIALIADSGDHELVRAAVTDLQRRDPPAVISVDNGRCRLADDIGSDLERFRHLTCRLDHLAPADQASAMQRALALVLGPPFADCGDWAHAEGLPTAAAALVSDVAHRLATLVLTFGDVERASWAVDQGLRASPGCELLYRDRMRIADACGDHEALDAIMQQLRTLAEEDDGWMTSETLQLYERLKRSTTITAAPSDDLDGHRHAS